MIILGGLPSGKWLHLGRDRGPIRRAQALANASSRRESAPESGILRTMTIRQLQTLEAAFRRWARHNR